MKWMYGVSDKVRAAVFLLLTGVLLLAGNVWLRSLLASTSHSFLSIYNDRLVPAAELFHVNDLMYSKRILIEKALAKHPEGTRLDGDAADQLGKYNHQLDSIIAAYETTYLVAEEREGLNKLKIKIDEYNQQEGRILQWHEPSLASAYYQSHVVPVFDQVHRQTLELSNIQTRVGAQLLDGSEDALGSANLLNYLHIGMVVLIILLVQALIWTSRSIIPKKPQKFHLN